MPCGPASPSPVRRMRVPSSTPAGMATCRVRSPWTVPFPWQTLHAFRMTRPVPPHVGQLRSTRKKPCWARTLPAPRHVPHVEFSRDRVSDPVPSQTSHLTRVGTRSCFFTPAKASTMSISTWVRRSAPPRGLRPRPDMSPNRPSKMSPRPPSKLKPPANPPGPPPPPCSKAAWPNRSYAPRFWSSLRTS